MTNNCFFIGSVANKKNSTTKTGKALLNFTLKTWDHEQNVEFLDCVAYGKQAELIDRDFPLGRIIYIEARAHSYKQQDDIKIQFVLREFKYLSKELSNENQGSNQHNSFAS
jgi:single-strand DNA-binding protein